MSTHRVFLSVGLCLILVTGFVVYRDLTHVREGNAGLSRGNVPLDEIPVEPSPYLEDQLIAGGPEHALLVEGETDSATFDLLATENDSAIDFLTGEAPSELPKVDTLDVVPLLTPDQRRENTEAIKQALPEISDERLEFWLEETRDLPPEMIRDMLMLRKHFGALTDSIAPDQAMKDLRVQQPQLMQADPTREMLLKARGLVLQNLMNEQSIGYLATELVFVEDASTIPSGMRLAETRLSLKSSDIQFTQRPLDVAFNSENTFLVVYDEEISRLTRYGRLKIGDDRRLYLAIEGTELLAAPGIVIPEGSDDIQISSNGEVTTPPNAEGEATTLGQLELKTVREPAYLRPVGTACYTTTLRSGDLIDLPESVATEALRPGCLQQSNVDPAQESWMRDRIDGWLKLWDSQTITPQTILELHHRPKSGNSFILDVF